MRKWFLFFLCEKGEEMSDRTLYIAYGSNINLEQMARRCPTAKAVANGVMLNYELEFRGVATIVPKADAKTPVLVWELGRADEKSLDRYEGFPHLYRKEYFEFEYNGEKREAMAYLMNGGEIHEPSSAYYKGIRKGYLDNELDVSYLDDALDRAIEHDENLAEDYGEEYHDDPYDQMTLKSWWDE